MFGWKQADNGEIVPDPLLRNDLVFRTETPNRDDSLMTTEGSFWVGTNHYTADWTFWTPSHTTH